jgi:Uma2 family endonuclease
MPRRGFTILIGAVGFWVLIGKWAEFRYPCCGDDPPLRGTRAEEKMGATRVSRTRNQKARRKLPSLEEILEQPIRMPTTAGTFEGFWNWMRSEGRPPYAHLTYIPGQIYIEVVLGGPMIEMPPSAVASLDGFSAWATSDDFPDWCRISYLDEEIFIDMSPEEIETHNKTKNAVATGITILNDELDLGEYFTDGTLLKNHKVGLSTEPDGILVKWQSYKAGKVRLTPRKDKPGQFMEVYGRPDWVWEVVSQTSVQNDTKQLRDLYHRAGIPEYWLIDARGEEIDCQILQHRRRGYVAVAAKDGWFPSRTFGRAFRLERHRNRMGRWKYELCVKTAR